MLIVTGILVTLISLVNGATVERPPDIVVPGVDCSTKTNGFYADYAMECRTFYRCQDGDAEVYDCSPHTRFNEGMRACVLAESYECTEPGAHIKKAVSYDCSKKEGYFPDEQNDCKSYYRCRDGIATSHECPDGRKFDTKINACVVNEMTNCGGNTQNARAVPAYDCSGRDDGYFAADGDCSTFHRCSRGIGTTHTCAEGLKYDPQINACVLAEMARCGGNAQNARAVQDYDCSGRDDGYYASDDDCTTFHRCNRGMGTTHTCKEGLRYDAQINACVLAETARCGSNGLVARGKDVTYDCSQAEDGFYANVEEGCRAFHFCHRQKGETYYCADGTLYDENQRACMPAADVRCNTRRKRVPSHGPPSWLIFDCANRNDGYYADVHRDCRQYYRCDNKKKTTYFCSPGTQFDETILTCIHEGPNVCPAVTVDRQIKFRKLRNLLHELREMIRQKKRR